MRRFSPCMIAANFVVDTILEMVSSDKISPDDSVAMIYRTNAQSRHLEEACVRKNLPYVIRGAAGGFYKRHEIKDCLCFLRWLYNGRDQSSLLRAMKTPSRGIGEKAVSDFTEYCADVDLFYQENFPNQSRPTPLDILISFTDLESTSPSILAEGAPEASVAISKRALNNFMPFSRQMREIRAKSFQLPVDALLSFIIDSLDLVSHFDSISKSKAEFEERRENVQELRQATKRYSKDGPAQQRSSSVLKDEFQNESALGNLLDDVALVTDLAGETDSGDSRLVVSLMTIHASKGTEFDAVFVVGNEDGTFPTSRAIQEGEGSVPLEEEKRLCYVAMTRAKTHLVMTWRREVTGFANWSDEGFKTQDKERSRFLDALVSKKGSKGSQEESALKGSRSQGSYNDNSLRAARLGNAASTNGSSRNYSSATREQSDGYGSQGTKRPPYSRGPPAWKDQPIQNRRSVPLSATQSARRASSVLERLSKKPEDEDGTKNQTQRPSAETPAMRNARMSSPRQQSTTNTPTRSEPPVARKRPEPTSVHVALTPKRPEPTVTARSSSINGSVLGNDIPAAKDTTLKKSSTKSANGVVDSTWFFPVGSSVVHKNFGRGTVQDPPSSESKKLLVCVEFESGKKMEFDASGTSIVPDLGF
jgi:DNA helicase-2/ATP-dependent DNA helicase PcrA